MQCLFLDTKNRLMLHLKTRRSTLSCLIPCLLMCACASPARVVLLPQADGTPSAVIVNSPTTGILLSAPYQRASLTVFNGLKSDTVSAVDIQREYSGLFAAVPKRQSKYILSFLPNSTNLTLESMAALPEVLEDVASRAGADVVITGHTDTKGALTINDALSLQRAEAVAQMLVDKGAVRANIESVGRGERELLIQTPDEVDEPQNRRVEITVR